MSCTAHFSDFETPNCLKKNHINDVETPNSCLKKTHILDFKTPNCLKKTHSLNPFEYSLSFNASINKPWFEIKEKMKNCPTWVYPCPKLISDLKKEGKKSLLIFSYGSLMDADSAKKTLSSTSMKTRRAAIAYGLKRVFDRDVPICRKSKWCTPIDPKARGMLNVHHASHFHFVNGVLVDVRLNDIPKFLSREKGYDLIPVIVQDWDDATQKSKKNYKIAYTFHSSKKSGFTNPCINPRPNYYELTRNACYQFGPLFSLIWFNTTYLSDGITPIYEWERKVQDLNPKTQAICE